MLVLGTESPDEHVSQVWVDKETFKPVRWLMPGQADDGRHFVREVRYLDWRQVNSVWYPMHMLFFQDDTLLREIRVEKMKVNLTFPAELFDVARLRFEHATQAEEANNEAVSEELNEVQKTIDEFGTRWIFGFRRRIRHVFCKQPSPVMTARSKAAPMSLSDP